MNLTDKEYRPRLTSDENAFILALRDYRQNNSQSTIQPLYESSTGEQDGDMYFILPDAHYPYQDQRLMDKIFLCIQDNAPKGVCISGDWMDLFTLGSYNADSLGLLKNITLTQEYEAGLKGIEELESVLAPDTERMFLWGNHEDRYFRTMNSRDTAKYGTELRHPNDALQLERYGYEVKTNWKDDFFTIGDLDITHGTYHNIHVAKKHLDMHGRSILFGHTHRAQTFYTGKEASFNVGCLCDLSSNAFNYMPRMSRNLWTNGFAVVNVIKGKSHVTPVIIRHGKFMVNGKLY